MSGWKTLHAKIRNPEKLPKESEITDIIDNKCRHSRTSIFGDVLYILVMERESDPLFRFARKYSEAFDIVAIGSGNDTGAGSDTVTFYNITGGQLERKTRQDCPATYDGLRVESTR